MATCASVCPTGTTAGLARYQLTKQLCLGTVYFLNSGGPDIYANNCSVAVCRCWLYTYGAYGVYIHTYVSTISLSAVDHAFQSCAHMTWWHARRLLTQA